MSFPNKEQRQRCWDARDRYWECLDKSDDPEMKNKDTVCKEFRKIYESTCPLQWVKHFDRKKQYLVFRDKVQNEGYEPIENLKPL